MRCDLREITLRQAETGLDADLNEFAMNNAALYGLVAVVGAGLLGWLASLPFRNA